MALSGELFPADVDISVDNGHWSSGRANKYDQMCSKQSHNAAEYTEWTELPWKTITAR